MFEEMRIDLPPAVVANFHSLAYKNPNGTQCYSGLDTIDKNIFKYAWDVMQQIKGEGEFCTLIGNENSVKNQGCIFSQDLFYFPGYKFFYFPP